MLRHWHIAPIVFAFAFASQPAYACMTVAPLKLEDVRYADVVVTGRVFNYKIIRDVEFRKQMLANPKLSPEDRARYEGPRQLLPDYARFEVQVQEVLKGKVPDRITVTWNNSTFGEPEEMASGPFLIALRYPSSKMPPLRGPSATILPNKEPGTLTVLQAPCAPAFIFPVTDVRVESIRRILRGEDNLDVSGDSP